MPDHAYRNFVLTRDAELVHDEDIKCGIKLPGHLVSHGHPASGQSQDQHIGTVSVVSEKTGQKPAGILSVTKQTVPHRAVPSTLGGRRCLTPGSSR